MPLANKLSPIAVNFTLRDHTYDVLRTEILNLNIYDEDTDLRLDEREIAEQLGVSRTPIREALAKLAHEGLVEIQPRKGIFVRRKTMTEILEMIITWAAFESMAARLAAEIATDEDFDNLREFAMKHSVDALRADLEEYSEANIQFHQRILNLSGCSLLKSSADQLFQHMHAVRKRAMRESNRAELSVVDHMGIIDALQSRDADLASKLVREHTMKLHGHIHRTWARLDGYNSDEIVAR